MKKTEKWRSISTSIEKILRVMKLTLFLFLAFSLQLSAKVMLGQQVTLELGETSVRKAFKELKRQTGTYFMYNEEDVARSLSVELTLDDVSLKEALNEICSQVPLDYEIVEDYVLIKKKTAVIKHPTNQQQEKKKINGTVTDEYGVRLPGVSVVVKGTSIGTATDVDGNFTMEIPNGTKSILVSFIGMVAQEIELGEKDNFKIALKADSENIDEVTIVAFGKQKKESVLASISTVKPAELRVPSSNLTTGLLGQIPGLTGFQAGGEPGADNVEFFIRGVTTFGYAANPLVLIDGVELTVEDLARLHPDDISSFSIMKDATATALYGARGANGVIYITTKEGKEGPVKVNVRVEFSRSEATDDIELADPITYMNMHNEAITTRDPLGVKLYSPRKIANTIAGADPLLYPVTDWKKELFKDYTVNKRMNLNLSGGGKSARYYVALAASNDNGILKVPGVSNFNSNIDIKKYMFRSNVNLNLTKTSKLKMSFNANYTDYTGPRSGGAEVYKSVMKSNPVLFRPFYERDAAHQFTKHILFGNGDDNLNIYRNPYAETVSGYKESTQSKIVAQLEFSQDLKMITDGLTFKATLNATRASKYSANRGYLPYWYRPTVSRGDDGSEVINFELLNEEEGTEHLNYNTGDRTIGATTYVESRINYIKKINEKHDLSALAVFTLNNRLSSIEKGGLQASLPFRNIGLAGRFTYGYDSRYLVELNFGYNGSERFAENERYGLFPSAGLGWIVSNEAFMDGGIKDVISSLKLKGSYGYVGNDAIGSSDDRFFYLSQVNLNDGGKSYAFGEDLNYSRKGISTSRYANPLITWETAQKINIGAEIGLFNKLDIEVDVFKEFRTNILATRIVPKSIGLEASVRDNIGEAESYGVDGSLVFSHNFSEGIWMQARANFTYATSEVTKMEEPDYTDTPWLSRIGQSINQNWGLVAERLFVDEAEINNSPTQGFGGNYGAGDIKYRDINKDGKITDLDKVPIGHQTRPEIVYGFGISSGYKGFDLSCFFQGQARRSFWVDPIKTAPFVDGNQLLKVWADDYWSESNRNPYAKWPRLSGSAVPNNTQRSTWFLQDGAFLRLKSVEIGYTLPKKVVAKLGLQKFRIYATGVNLVTWSKFKLWDVEMAGNGLGYPNQKVFNIGAKISF